MSYPEKYRERTIEYRKAGHTLEETHQTFKVTIATIRKWEKQLEEEGTVLYLNFGLQTSFFHPWRKDAWL